MAKTIKIMLAGQEYEVPRINVGQTEDLAEFGERTGPLGEPIDANGDPLRGKPLVTYTIGIANVVLRRASPPMGDVRALECDLGALQAAVTAVMEFNRLGEPDASGNAAAGASPAA